MSSFALYRLPLQQQAVLVEQTCGEPLELMACEELNGREGFVLSPFVANAVHPILLIRPDRKTTVQIGDIGESFIAIPENQLFNSSTLQFFNSLADNYRHDFELFHNHLTKGDFQKIVLSRCEELPRDGGSKPILLFKKACQLYPKLFIALVFTPKSGLWLTATPEVLLESDGHQWHTIALAGTIRSNGQEEVKWSKKNKDEQRMVATYIRTCLEKQGATDIGEEGPRTVSAANLLHLRTDFTFNLSEGTEVGDLLGVLHPTPAVCGLPKQEALRFITANEHTPRLYYSGFMGPLSPLNTHLYVSLRCMQITPDRYRLYAGGGLLPESDESLEWMETEAKLYTMRQCL